MALISVTVVPALIPTFIRGRLRGEEENWIVRSFIHIYKPMLTWALPRRNLVMWAFAALLILAAGLFPLQALFGLGASDDAWRTMFFLARSALVTVLTVLFTRGLRWQVLSLVTLVAPRPVGVALPEDRRVVHADARRGDDARHAGHRAAGERHPGGRRPEGPRRAAPRLPRGGDR